MELSKTTCADAFSYPNNNIVTFIFNCGISFIYQLTFCPNEITLPTNQLTLSQRDYHINESEPYLRQQWSLVLLINFILGYKVVMVRALDS